MTTWIAAYTYYRHPGYMDYGGNVDNFEKEAILDIAEFAIICLSNTKLFSLMI